MYSMLVRLSVLGQVPWKAQFALMSISHASWNSSCLRQSSTLCTPEVKTWNVQHPIPIYPDIFDIVGIQHREYLEQSKVMPRKGLHLWAQIFLIQEFLN